MPRARIPFKARLSRIHQRTILTVRWFFRLPIDDIKEAGVQAQIASLEQINRQALETITTLMRVSNNLQARLKFYEERIPRMRELKKELERLQAEAAMQSNDGLTPDDMDNGILSLHSLHRAFAAPPS